MRGQIRVLLVDDHELTRHGLRRMLELEGNMEIVGECPNADEAFSQIGWFSPDVVLMDTQMPGMNGIEATRRLKRNGMNYDGDVIMLAESADYQVEAMEAGAASYLLKDTTRVELAQAIRKVYWSKHSLGECDNFTEEVELVIPPPADAAQILRFIDQVEKTLHASILQTVGSWDRGTAMTILPKPIPFVKLLDKLGNMPGVEKAEKGPLARDSFSNSPGKFRSPPRSKASPAERILITLN